MIIGFIIWSSVALLLLGIGIWAWNSGTPVGFFSGVKPPEVKDIRQYNHSVAVLWFVYAILFETLGIPFLFLGQNHALFVVSILGTVGITFGLVIAYHRILQKCRKE
jgi:hypothetical protein